MSKLTRAAILAIMLFATTLLNSQTQLVNDGDFEANNGSWHFYQAGQLCSGCGSPYTGVNYGIHNLNQNTGVTGEIWQYIGWPANVLSGNIQFKYYITTQEGNSGIQYDKLYVKIIDYQTTNEFNFTILSNLDASSGYYSYYHTLTSTEIYKIGLMTNPCLSFWSDNDFSLPSAFRIDNVGMSVNTGQNAPSADFVADNTNPCINTSVTFTDVSTSNPTSWLWNFGDGLTSTSTLKNPSHTYNTTGTFTVSLTATNGSGSNYISKNNYMVVKTCSSIPQTDFTSDYVAPIKIGKSVNFFDNSTNMPTSWSWRFYDGSASTGYQISTLQYPNPVKYNICNESGYTVFLQSTNAIGTDTKIKTNYIIVNCDHTGVEQNQNSLTYSLHTYPNPASEKLNVEFEDELIKENSNLVILNVMGQVIYSLSINLNTHLITIDLSKFNSGFYTLQVTSEKGYLITQKFIKK